MNINSRGGGHKVLVTGANGFIGRALCRKLLESGYEVHAVVRKLSDPVEHVRYLVADLESNAMLDIKDLGIDCIVHLAGRAHILSEQACGALERYRAVNCEATVRLAQCAIDADVRRFIFISSIGVNGSETGLGPFDELSIVQPHADYAVSKYEAELQLGAMLAHSPVELVIVRPPLVYDAGAPGNFARLLRLVSAGLPLPFAAVDNKRSMVSLGNLVGFLEVCIKHPNAARELFLIADCHDLSTTEIVQSMAEGMGKRLRLFSVPIRLASFGAKLIGRQNLYVQLFCSLQVNSAKARRLLDWHPEENAQDALVKVGRNWREKRSD
ncbi:NAD-dependent epimerase/dehydratase family protein [Pseudomonas corrugata]|uniref:NAD-dependent epimerase/dehydratase family protein n=1 Tax=Pseudomonas corrugata TaxID=47879 RepID=UPI00087D7663|nr:NAD-dependent epimerase/dehydratase family protein [Pseudomonas corrugata]SDV00002.1 Nucleoside-diphosphate-sugar epimerase [Pseudomonas corrugata]